MTTASRRPSLDERVSWTNGFTKPADKVVLGALAFFADFESGRNARPGMRRLVPRAGLPKRTVERSLRRLLDEGWIMIQDTRHLGATTYTIVLERLATSRADAKVVIDRSPSPIGAKVVASDDDVAPADRGSLSANLADKDADLLSANLADLSANLADTVRQLGGRTRDQVPVISTQEHRRAERGAPAATDHGTTTPTTAGAAALHFLDSGGESGMAPTEGATLAVRGADVRADGRDREGHDPATPDGGRREPERADQAATPGAGLQLPERPDPSRDRGADRSGAQPVQQSFGPLALDPAQRRAALVTLGDVWRAAVEQARKRRPPRARSS